MVEISNLLTIIEMSDTKKMRKALAIWGGDAIGAEPMISDDVRLQLMDRAKQFLSEREHRITYALLACLASTSPSPKVESLKHSFIPRANLLKDHQSTWESLHFQEQFTVRILKDWGIFAKDENILLMEAASAYFGNPNLQRQGAVYLTDKRIVICGSVRGPFVKNHPSHRLLYDNPESLPFLNVIDFVNLSDIKEHESIWKWGKKLIELQVHTRYAKEKGSTLYGPYFFKWDRPSTVKEEEGLLKIEIELEDIPVADFPKDWKKTRQETFVRLLTELLSR